MTCIRFGFAVIPPTSLLDSFSVVSALLSTDCRFVLEVVTMLERGVALIGLRAVEVAVGLAGGLDSDGLTFEGVVLLADEAVGWEAFEKAVVDLFKVDGRVVGVVPGLVEVVNGFFVVLEIAERPVPEVGSSPKVP